ncbi:hypothetical protein CEE37_07635 [candidate division LCP-89 bacterium B3_LCP]|uniref:Uncharacterized protein n=1 Tax=candidate division LCP-89 bacterium B3_LCP TaxID=2012998 RepID=A0A532V1H6_UNCL8|nr:MAG: hypothetical protein CEE37_07635 [candidate division LCP-89 bacterium B3_LCP]
MWNGFRYTSCKTKFCCHTHGLPIIIFATIFLLLIGCDTGDDLSQPLDAPPLQRTFSIVGHTTIFNQICFQSNYYENGVLAEIQYFLFEDDTVYLKGYEEIGGDPVEINAIFSPANPQVGTEWYGLYGYPAKFIVEDLSNVSVPAGIFNSFIYSISDSITGELIGSMILAENIGLVAMTQILSSSGSLSMVLEAFTIYEGEGVFPLAAGNNWQLVEGTYTIDGSN